MGTEAPINVVGFPKSGNTWLLRMLCDICEANIDASDVVNMADYKANAGRLIRKIHFANALDRSSNERTIYIARDIRDVLVSAFFFNNSFVSEKYVTINEPFSIKRYLARQYFRHQIRRMNLRWCGNEYAELLNWINGHAKKDLMGLNWSDHICHWINNPSVFVVRYEDLLLDTISTMEKVLKFLQVEYKPDELNRIVHTQSFKEKKRYFQAEGNIRNDQFLRRGEAGDWVRFLDDELIDEIMLVHKKGMVAMGYLDAK